MTNNRKLLIAISAVVLISLIFAVIMLHHSKKNEVEIIRDNNVIYRFDLNTATDQTIYIASDDGGYNIVSINNGTICISEADCPDRTCVKMGKLSSEFLPLVCLPHKLIVRFAEDNI